MAKLGMTTLPPAPARPRSGRPGTRPRWCPRTRAAGRRRWIPSAPSRPRRRARDRSGTACPTGRCRPRRGRVRASRPAPTRTRIEAEPRMWPASKNSASSPSATRTVRPSSTTENRCPAWSASSSVYRGAGAGAACGPFSAWRYGACAPRPPPGCARSRASRSARSPRSARWRTPARGTPASPAGAAGRSGRGARGSGARRRGGRGAPGAAPSCATAGRVPAAGRSRRARARARCPAGSASRSRTARRRGR